MIEMRSDLGHKARLDAASIQARKEGAGLHDPMSVRLDQLREKQLRKSQKKRRLPWFTIISIVSCAPLLFMGDMMPSKSMGGGSANVAAVSSTAGISPQAAQTAAAALGDKKATVSVTIGGKTFTREVSARDIQALQSQ
jgi:hypothetical protein